jgi:prepilin-type N-terminal cleavage/methylation domain-containing protein/prepilin-type processing-associated H-X9-DG protein
MPRKSGFTLVEVLIVIAMIAILAALLLPTIERARSSARRAQCVSQLRQVGIAFQGYSHDHNGDFPMKVSTNAGGSKEFVDAANRITGNFYFAFRHLQALSNDLGEAKVLACPTDRRVVATNFPGLRNGNISYFVNAEASAGDSDSILAGDGNIATTAPRIVAGRGQTLSWTAEMHRFAGNVLFGDGHVERWNNPALAAATGGTPGNNPPPNVFVPIIPPAEVVDWSAGGPTSRGGSGNGGGSAPPGTSSGVFSQLDEVAKRNARSGTTIPLAETNRARSESSNAISPLGKPIEDSKVAAVPAPALNAMVDSGWPKRLSHNGYWPLYVFLLIALALLLAFELLRRHRKRRADRW